VGLWEFRNNPIFGWLRAIVLNSELLSFSPAIVLLLDTDVMAAMFRLD
jgi:hypothetical protein